MSLEKNNKSSKQNVGNGDKHHKLAERSPLRSVLPEKTPSSSEPKIPERSSGDSKK